MTEKYIFSFRSPKELYQIIDKQEQIILILEKYAGSTEWPFKIYQDWKQLSKEVRELKSGRTLREEIAKLKG